MNPPLILFLYDNVEKARQGSSYQHEAASVGFQVISANWRSIEPSAQGVFVREGREVGPGKTVRPVLNQHVAPRVLLHRKLIWGQSEELIRQLSEHVSFLCSYHPCWKPIGRKWVFETCFRAAELTNITVPRPAADSDEENRSFRAEDDQSIAERHWQKYCAAGDRHESRKRFVI